MISVIIPTLSRPNDLIVALLSVTSQSLRPDEIIIIDQSSDDSSRCLVIEHMSKFPEIDLKYILDDSISGLVHAKATGAKLANGSLVAFFEDDIVLDKSFLEEAHSIFQSDNGIQGICGVVKNQGQLSLIYRLFFRIFHIGIFRDPRVTITRWKFLTKEEDLIRSTHLSGGLSIWRNTVFENIKFDLESGFHLYEDIDWSLRVHRFYGGGLYISNKCIAQHHPSPINRLTLGARQLKKVSEAYRFYSKNRASRIDDIALIILYIGMLVEASYDSMRYRSPESVLWYLKGTLSVAKNIYKGYYDPQ